MSRRLATLLAIVASLLLIAPAAGADTQVVAEVPDLGTNGAPVPALAWAPCTPAEGPADAQCTTVRVPLSYREPHGPTIELALGRLPATDPAHKIGTLFWNPGGPGGSGRIPLSFTRELQARFDLVGFDPRGIAASTPLRCFDSNQQAITFFAWEFPITLTQTREVIELSREGTELCGQRGGPIMSHMATGNVARDLDLLRQAVGDEQLTFLGFSYGTHVGAVYANLFPDRVRAVTLDAVIDPVEWTTGASAREAQQPVEYRAGSFHGSYRALLSFLADCRADVRCAFREGQRDLRAKFDALMDRLKRQPAQFVGPDGNPFEVTYQGAVGFTLGGLYSEFNATPLALGLQDLWIASGPSASRVALSSGSRLREIPLHPSRAARAPAVEPYAGIESLPAVECTDSDNPSDPWLWPAYARRADHQAPYFGSLWLYMSLPCATWPVKDPDRYTGPWNRATANPLMLIGNSEGDPATPYEDAVSTSSRLADARLLTYEAWGHTGFLAGSNCVDGLVERYLITKQLPRQGAVCRRDTLPFDPPPPAAAAIPFGESVAAASAPRTPR